MTQHYVGTKIVLAWPEERNGVPGYAVRYEDGYTSWSPADTFNAANLPLGHIGQHPPFVQRMIAEQAQAADRLTKLSAFLLTDTFAGLPAEEQEDQAEQHRGMSIYRDALVKRIARATSKQA